MESLEELLGQNNEPKKMDLKEGELLFIQSDLKRSKRLLEVDELVSLISESRGISRRALMNLTGNMLRKDLKKLEERKCVKAKEVSEISYKKPQKAYYSSKKLSISSVKLMELMSYGIWYLRERELKIGRVTTKEDGNLLATAVINENTYSMLEIVGINQRNYIRKLASANVKKITDLNKQKNEIESLTQTVLVIDSRELMLVIKKEYVLKNIVVILVQSIGTKKVIRGFSNEKIMLNDYDFKGLKVQKGNREVERVLEGYNRLNSINTFRK
ncbi:hypothetical protein K5E_11240 [Enterococcus thailandicus]|uniref:hypothetical protein n=1 Tax=Enterococcus thailandicus TaxID=417368 RepID=UPI00244D9376|nr:hypothetical protein [Enterococcus thailandicus]GMC02578.1 hypothetical protein K4E_00880 [Enterococcus thailandicus]GMC08985.1 hypothetical protein K5E_11240 [Enterococcus thailandicus]